MRLAVRVGWMGMVMLASSALAGGQTTGPVEGRRTSLAFERAAHLQRGINLSMWYAQAGAVTAEHTGSYTTAEDMKLVKSLGFDHVRLSIDPEPLIADPQRGSLRAEAIERLDKSVDQLLAAGLNVVLDVHPEYAWKAALATGEDGPARFAAFWDSFASHFAKSDPSRVFFELMNEPAGIDPIRWQGIQARVVARVRRVTPQHTILATGGDYSKNDDLMAIEPVRDENVIYSFHAYEPMWFTHQGASWGSQGWVFLRGVPYPSTPENVLKVLGQEPDERVRLFVQRYGSDRWDAVRIGMEVAAVAQWAQQRGVPLYCGEFGVYRMFADPQSRATWISDVRNALESKHIGWSMWDYQGDFGLVMKSGKGTTIDQGVLNALGMARK